MATVKNILFDLGGVLINLDIGRTEAAFAALVGDRAQHRSIYRELLEKRVFEHFETDTVDEAGFIEAIHQHNPLPITDNQIRTAWSAMLLDLPAERLELLRWLRDEGYRIFLLSNINSIHLRDFYSIVEQQHGIDFDALFDKTYYSHLIRRRKPDPTTYQFVLDDAGLLAPETLFIDDNADNVIGAQSIGIQTIHHVANGDTVRVIRERLG